VRRSRSSRSLSYTDALKLLGVDENPALGVIGRIGSVAALGASVATVGALDLFSVRDELVDLGNAAIKTLRERLSGLGSFDRTQRLTAAHAVLVITAFFEAFDEALRADGFIDIRNLQLSRGEQAALATGSGAFPQGYRGLVSELVDSPVPRPAASQPYEDVLAELRQYYESLLKLVETFVRGLATFEDDSERITQSIRHLEKSVPGGAIRRYEIGFRALAVDAPEFGVWVSLIEGQATRASVGSLKDEMREGLAAVEAGLAVTAGGSDAMLIPSLMASYHGRLARPILESTSAVDGIVFPSLQDGYISPHCRIGASRYGSEPARQSWWSTQPVATDAVAAVVSHLTGPDAARVPAVVLGQPGSGKSLLTEVLAARLAESGFLPVRVELRNVAEDVPLQAQVELAIHLATGETVSWPQVVRSAGHRLPVVLIDGLDEMLQASDLPHADYLEEVQRFQDREYSMGRPVAVLVTSRLIVTDRLRYPAGCVVMRLEPFDEDQVRGWLTVWNGVNKAGFARRAVRELPAETVLAHQELSAQPLLLLMLALHDATDNALQRSEPALGRAELYDRLVTDFAGREVRRRTPGLSIDAERQAIEEAIHRLAVVALAMFTRRRTSATEAEIDQDLLTLLDESGQSSPRGFRQGGPAATALSVIGTFFFVHSSQVISEGGQVNRSFEFLHATFGEFLVARIAVSWSAGLATWADGPSLSLSNTDWTQHAAAVIPFSFAFLPSRPSVIEFCSGLIARLPTSMRTEMYDRLAGFVEWAMMADLGSAPDHI
jgi:hypothetical protein